MMIKLNKRKELLVVVSKGMQVMMPQIIGINKDEAYKILKNHKLNLHIEKEEYSMKVKKGCVISQSIEAGNKITYSIETKGTHNVYQWYKNNVKIAGATLSSYTTSTLYASDNGDYYTCSVSNTFF